MPTNDTSKDDLHLSSASSPADCLCAAQSPDRLEEDKGHIRSSSSDGFLGSGYRSPIGDLPEKGHLELSSSDGQLPPDYLHPRSDLDKSHLDSLPYEERLPKDYFHTKSDLFEKGHLETSSSEGQFPPDYLHPRSELAEEKGHALQLSCDLTANRSPVLSTGEPDIDHSLSLNDLDRDRGHVLSPEILDRNRDLCRRGGRAASSGELIFERLHSASLPSDLSRDTNHNQPLSNDSTGNRRGTIVICNDFADHDCEVTFSSSEFAENG